MPQAPNRATAQPATGPDCWQCRHHFITYDPGLPYGCQAMNFKSRRLPCIEVRTESATPCLMFERKTERPLAR